MSDGGDLKDKGVSFVAQAVKEDEAGNLAKAFQLYMTGLDYLSSHLKYEKNPKYVCYDAFFFVCVFVCIYICLFFCSLHLVSRFFFLSHNIIISAHLPHTIYIGACQDS